MKERWAKVKDKQPNGRMVSVLGKKELILCWIYPKRYLERK